MAECHPERKDHAGGLCRECYRNGGRAKKATCHPDRLQAANGLCRECYRNLHDNKVKAIKVRRLKKYKLSEDLYNEMYDRQKGECAICEGEIEVVDHCHKTLNIRGLLCRKCNTGIGHFRDSVEYLKSAIIYLESNNEYP